MPRRKTMNVSLTPEMEAFVFERVSSGRYRSNSEVLRAALRLLEDQERDTAPTTGVSVPRRIQLAQQPLPHSPADAGE